MMKRILKSTTAIVLAIALIVTGFNVDMVSPAADINQKVTQKEFKITAKQKEEAQKEDAKVREKLKETKESKKENKKGKAVRELKEFRTSNSTTYLLSNGSRKIEIETVEWRSSYITFLQDINKNNSKQGYEFVIKDLDGDAIPELIVKEKLKLTVYRQNKEVEEVGSYNFATGTTRLFSSESMNYPGIFYFYVSGGLNHYGYIDIQDKELNIQELWNEDYSGIYKEMGEERERIEKFSDDDKIIKESRDLYTNNNDLAFIEVSTDNINLDELITK